MTAKRKEETCEEQLRRMCRSIAMDITDGKQQAPSKQQAIDKRQATSYNRIIKEKL